METVLTLLILENGLGEALHLGYYATVYDWS